MVQMCSEIVTKLNIQTRLAKGSILHIMYPFTKHINTMIIFH